MIQPVSFVPRFIYWENRKVLEQREQAVADARKNHPRLQGRTLLGRGVFSLVFDAGPSVLKLTLDRVAYELAEQQASWSCAALPVTVALHGQVGMSAMGAPLWLIEQERLERLPTGSAQRKDCLQVGRLMRRHASNHDKVPDLLRAMLPSVRNPSLADGLERLAEFAAARAGWAPIDLHASNFMLRAATAEAVISDPFIDHDTRQMAYRHDCRRRGVPVDPRDVCI